MMPKVVKVSRILLDPEKKILLANKFSLFTTDSYMLQLFATNRALYLEVQLC